MMAAWLDEGAFAEKLRWTNRFTQGSADEGGISAAAMPASLPVIQAARKLKPPIRPKTSSVSPQMCTPGACLDSSVARSTEVSGTPPPVTSALEYPACPATGSAYRVRSATSALRSSLRSSASDRRSGTPASAASACASRAGRCSRRRLSTSPLPPEVSRAFQTDSSSPLQLTSNWGDGEASAPPPRPASSSPGSRVIGMVT
mmetsp:Transcript_20072/g.65398  ORF Transcript_20072/g.65398 Transcript_20072/m.65398 type:complete len:202 (-) Transcript_20072:438-1043(-)